MPVLSGGSGNSTIAGTRVGVSARIFHEAVPLGATITYATGGITVTVATARLIAALISANVKPVSGAGLGLVAQPVAGSESGNTVKVQVVVTGAAAGDAMQELASGSTLLQGATLEVSFAGT